MSLLKQQSCLNSRRVWLGLKVGDCMPSGNTGQWTNWKYTQIYNCLWYYNIITCNLLHLTSLFVTSKWHSICLPVIRAYYSYPKLKLFHLLQLFLSKNGPRLWKWTRSKFHVSIKQKAKAVAKKNILLSCPKFSYRQISRTKIMPSNSDFKVNDLSNNYAEQISKPVTKLRCRKLLVYPRDHNSSTINLFSSRLRNCKPLIKCCNFSSNNNMLYKHGNWCAFRVTSPSWRGLSFLTFFRNCVEIIPICVSLP